MPDPGDPIEQWQHRLDLEGSVTFAPARWRFVAFFVFALCIAALAVAGIVDGGPDLASAAILAVSCLMAWFFGRRMVTLRPNLRVVRDGLVINGGRTVAFGDIDDVMSGRETCGFSYPAEPGERLRPLWERRHGRKYFYLMMRGVPADSDDLAAWIMLLRGGTPETIETRPRYAGFGRTWNITR
jgi:hypothetical protein